MLVMTHMKRAAADSLSWLERDGRAHVPAKVFKVLQCVAIHLSLVQGVYAKASVPNASSSRLCVPLTLS